MIDRQDDKTAAVMTELIQREPIFHRPEFGTTRADFEKMMAEDFWEVGASGQIYSRAFVTGRVGKTIFAATRRRFGNV